MRPLPLQTDHSALLAMMKYQTHSSTLITNGLTGNDDGAAWVQSSALMTDYFQSRQRASRVAAERFDTKRENSPKVSSLLFAAVSLGGRPDFTSDNRNPTRKQTRLVFIGDDRRSSVDQNLTTSDPIFPTT